MAHDPEHVTNPEISSALSKESIKTRLGRVAQAVGGDYRESSHRTLTVTAGLGMAALQSLDRLRASIILVPTLAVNVLEVTQSPTQAALAGGAAFGAWCLAVGGATTEGLAQYPTAVATFGREFPSAVDFFEDSLPGLNKSTKERSRVGKVVHEAKTRLHRSTSVIGIGTSAYVSTAAAQGRSRSAIHALNANASLDGGLLAGAVVYGVGEGIQKLAGPHPELALQIQDKASNIYTWYAVAGLSMAAQFASTRVARRKEQKAEK